MEKHVNIPDTYIGPGLFDLQLNGYAGFDFNGECRTWSTEDFLLVRDALQSRGVVCALPTLITDSGSRLEARAQTYAKLVDRNDELALTFPGLHIEGPFISSDDGPRGAHPLKFCRNPSAVPDLIKRLMDASGGRIKIVTLAPELDGAVQLIEHCCAMGIVVALGHTNADADTITRAVAAGARLSTHLGNGSHQVLPRLDNYVQHQLANDQLFASFIADGHHIPFPTLKNFIRAKTCGRSILVTDAIAAAGCGAGVYQLGEAEVVVDDNLKCQIPGQPNLAGSALTLDLAVLNTVRYCDVSFDEAWNMASSRPAKLVGLPEPARVKVQIGEGGFSS